MIVRSLSEQDIQALQSALVRLTENPSSDLATEARELIHSGVEIDNANEVHNTAFANKLQLAEHVAQALKNVDRAEIDLDAGLWAWLALFYFDQLVKRDEEGKVILRDLALYIPALHSWREYRHLIRGPYKVYEIHGGGARLLLLKPINVWSDLEEQMVGVQELIRMPGAMRAADILYFDEKKNEAKRGATNRKRDGNIRRFGAVLQQFDLTYDLFGMTGDQLVEMLPKEFNRFRT